MLILIYSAELANVLYFILFSEQEMEYILINLLTGILHNVLKFALMYISICVFFLDMVLSNKTFHPSAVTG